MALSLYHLAILGLVVSWTALAQADSEDGVQLHLRNCRQSSDYAGLSRCSGAIDGTTSGKWSYTAMSCTNVDTVPWWETQTEQVTEFRKVRIFNRQDCCPERLNNFVIKVDGHVCATYNKAKSFAVETFECRRKGRVLRIESRKATHLTLAEVQVFGFETGPKTVAPRLALSNCLQSSDYAGRSKCSGAIDGHTSGAWSYTRMSCTGVDARPWWEARTDAPSKIKQVRIFNRQDCCPDRLNNFVIKVDDVVCAEYNSHASFAVWTFDCNRVGRTVRIESRKATHLTLAEVQVFGEPTDGPPEPVQLRLKNCRQSSDYAGLSRCSGAIDGTTSGSWSYTGMSCTNVDTVPWWETQTAQLTEFVKVRIFNRQDCCAERLNNFVIKVDGHVCASYNSATTFATKTFKCNREGRVLRIESRKATHLTLAEVQVFGFKKGPRVPLSQLHLSNCHQSSNYAGRSRCSGAIDGNTNQGWSYTHMSCTNVDQRPWWEASTDAPTHIKQVRIFNRQDCCPERLNNFVIKVDDVECAEYNSKASFAVWTFRCNKVGRTVRIESRKATHLTLAEVQVFGDPTPEVPSKPEPVQLHLRNCRQSSDYAGLSRCSGAIDGTTSGSWSYTAMSCTNVDKVPWWETQLEQLTEIATVRIFNRQDCCAERLNNFVIKVDGRVCASYDNPASFASRTFKCHAHGRVLRIESRKATHLTLAEVQVFGFDFGPKSQAPQLHLSSCRQSSNYAGRSKCTGAIDGHTSGSWSYTRMSCTNADQHPWWEASTEKVSNFKRVRIFNRQDCCPERLNNFVIKVDGEVCAEYDNKAAFAVWSFDCNVIGRTIRIESRKATHLTLAEVQVFGEPAVKECFRQQEAFVGASNVTATGKPCQAWSVKSCADTKKGASCHVPSEFLRDAELSGNTCRNPPDYMRDRPWCYTTTATRWEYCSVPEC